MGKEIAMSENTKLVRSENPAEFVVKNMIFCPIREDVSDHEYYGWGCRLHPSEDEYHQCAKCVLKHSAELDG